MILVQCHSTTMRTVEVLEKNLLSLTWNFLVLTSFLVLHTKLSKPWDVTHQISQADNSAKPALLLTRTPITWMKSPGLHNTLLAFPCGCFLWTFALFALVCFKQLTLLQAMEKYRGSEMAFWKLSLGNCQVAAETGASGLFFFFEHTNFVSKKLHKIKKRNKDNRGVNAITSNCVSASHNATAHQWGAAAVFEHLDH